jgi:leucyl/phenylalanyl-tRNA---protein transferase
MFHRVTDASKVAVIALTDRLSKRGFSLLDIQMVSDHTATFGAIEISRHDYLERLNAALAVTARFD